MNRTTEKVAFAMLRMQPFTNGHFRIISQMIRDNDVVIIGLGSIQIEGTANNPFSTKQRTEMIRKVFGYCPKGKIKIVPIPDLGAVKKEDWVAHCMKNINDKNLPTPNRYYAGSETDLVWFENAVNLNNEKIVLINLERHQTNILSGTFVRQSISNGTNEWEGSVPECLIDYIKDNYPKELTLEYHLGKKGNK